MEQNLRPTKSEIEFLNLAFNRFYDIYNEIMNDDFWTKDEIIRFAVLKDGFAIYAELLNYEPIKWIIEKMKTERPPMESEIGGELFKFIRNIISHFPFFTKWNDIFLTKQLVNWNKPGLTIDKFIEKYKGKPSVKYRFWETEKKQMTYLEINFPSDYKDEKKIYLKNIITEMEGVKFSFILMRQIINTQIIK